MKDFDFDELDRAVNTVLTAKKPTSEPADNNDVQPAETLSIDDTHDGQASQSIDDMVTLGTTNTTAHTDSSEPASLDERAGINTTSDTVAEAVPTLTTDPADEVSSDTASTDWASADDTTSDTSTVATIDELVASQASSDDQVQDTSVPPTTIQIDGGDENDDTAPVEDSTVELSSDYSSGSDTTASYQPLNGAKADQQTHADDELSNNTDHELASDVAIDSTEGESDSGHGDIESLPQTSSSSSDTSRLITPPRRGRFMDMMHPSANMKHGASDKPELMVKKPLTVQPPISTLEDVSSPGVADGTDASPAQSDDSSASTNTPTPEIGLDSTVVAHDTTAEPDSETTVSQEDAIESTDSVTPAIETVPPVVPFIPDVPVEKRPLGAHGDPQTVEDALSHDQSAAAQSSEAVTDIGEVAKAARTVEEQALTAVESKEDIGEPAASKDPASAVTPMASAVAPSIARQYTVQDTTPDTDHHAVFDTNEYHQPINAISSHKKSSPKLWVAVAIGLVLVSIALGVVWFLYGQGI